MSQNSPQARLNEQARTDAYATPLDKIDVSNGELYEKDIQDPYFERLRREDPVHHTGASPFGPYWSITKFNDIMHVETNHKTYSSEGNVVIGDQLPEFAPGNFISHDPPLHDVQRAAVAPAVSPMHLSDIEAIIRQRVGVILDAVPRNETFNWVEHVSIELTTQMLATLFDVPFEERHKLPYWSDVATSSELVGNATLTEVQRKSIMMECLAYFSALWKERATRPAAADFISLLAHNPKTKDMINDPMEFLGNLTLLIIGGNDTTRNSISGGVLALNQNPDQYRKLMADPGLIPKMVPEIIRWQTPLLHMRRTALQDAELGGKHIKKGDKVVMWYISGNRDDEVIDRPNEFIIDRPTARHHLSFGFGIHRCMGNRVAEMQLRILWEEILKRFKKIELMGDPVRIRSNFVRGITDLPVRIAA
jgi:cytochrome P450